LVVPIFLWRKTRYLDAAFSDFTQGGFIVYKAIYEYK